MTIVVHVAIRETSNWREMDAHMSPVVIARVIRVAEGTFVWW